MARILARARSVQLRSIGSQQMRLAEWATEQGHEIVGWVEDEVEPNHDPFETSLAEWFTGSRIGLWDRLVACTTWGLTTSDEHMIRLDTWCRAHDKGMETILEGDAWRATLDAFG
ncbi:hypothetical protein [Saccharomonospora iraqiensis]|uniref:hypothetical protein n=1 Tax=Saccharomonospora iraqiensis TaxID=52698 RepID=UPI00022E07D6|nr:hypothetical protein [Saccharomonospora iraqiensis]